MATTAPTNAAAAQGFRPITVAWVVLCAMTIASWWLSPAHSGTAAVPSLPITVAVVVLGLIKSRLIIRYFMEVRSAPRWLRLATDCWLVVLWAGALIIYLY